MKPWLRNVVIAIVLLFPLMIGFQNCNPTSNKMSTNEHGPDPLPVPEPGPSEKPCGDVKHGEKKSRTMYESDLVSWDGICVSEPQECTCNDGEFSSWEGEIGFAHNICAIAIPQDCDDLGHSKTRTRTMYREPEVPNNIKCHPQTQAQTCINGELSHWDPNDFMYEECHSLGQSCGDVPDGGSESRTAYEKDAVPLGELCVSEPQERRCDNGKFTEWEGKNNYTYLDCRVGQMPGFAKYEYGIDGDTTTLLKPVRMPAIINDKVYFSNKMQINAISTYYEMFEFNPVDGYVKQSFNTNAEDDTVGIYGFYSSLNRLVFESRAEEGGIKLYSFDGLSDTPLRISDTKKNLEKSDWLGKPEPYGDRIYFRANNDHGSGKIYRHDQGTSVSVPIPRIHPDDKTDTFSHPKATNGGILFNGIFLWEPGSYYKETLFHFDGTNLKERRTTTKGEELWQPNVRDGALFDTWHYFPGQLVVPEPDGEGYHTIGKLFAYDTVSGELHRASDTQGDLKLDDAIRILGVAQGVLYFVAAKNPYYYIYKIEKPGDAPVQVVETPVLPRETVLKSRRFYYYGVDTGFTKLFMFDAYTEKLTPIPEVEDIGNMTVYSSAILFFSAANAKGAKSVYWITNLDHITPEELVREYVIGPDNTDPFPIHNQTLYWPCDALCVYRFDTSHLP